MTPAQKTGALLQLRINRIYFTHIKHIAAAKSFTEPIRRQVIAHGFAALQDMGDFVVDFCDCQRMGAT